MWVNWKKDLKQQSEQDLCCVVSAAQPNYGAGWVCINNM